MGRGRDLSESEQAQITSLHQLGHSYREIANVLGRSTNAIHNHLNKPQKI